MTSIEIRPDTERGVVRAAPMAPSDLLALDNVYPTPDRRPFGKVTRSARSFWIDPGLERGAGIELARSGLDDDAVELIADAPLNAGLPGRDLWRGESLRAAGRRTHGEAESFVPEGLAIAYHPKIAPPVARRVARRADGRKVVLSEAPHVTIFGDESREFIYPDAYPYCAVCKLHVETQAAPGAPWGGGGHATGFLVGRRSLMTAGHVAPDPNAHAWRMQVIPACWGGRSVFGMEYGTWARSAKYWATESGSGDDIMICELYDPIGDDLGYFGATTYDSDWEDRATWTMCGFPFDRSLWAPSRQNAIAVRDDDDGDDIGVNGGSFDTTQVESDADEASGASGAPLFAWFNDGNLYAIGTHSGASRDGTISGEELLSNASGGAGFVEAVRWARDLWP